MARVEDDKGGGAWSGRRLQVLETWVNGQPRDPAKDSVLTWLELIPALQGSRPVGPNLLTFQEKLVTKFCQLI